PEVAALGVEVEARPYQPGDVAGYRLVIAATDDPATNHAVSLEADGLGTWVNSADDPDFCTFTLPSVVRRGPIMATVSTGGRSPALATWIRARIAEYLGPEFEVLVSMLSTAREDMKSSGRSTEGADWQSLLDSDILNLLKSGQVGLARERLQSWLSSSSD
ncbi:MAG: bifunctional precorrin-2 dehydrogenase/sirohydrochlorin ferrochelatase, partial [Actinomycetota bacterium]|nr:bifunctional precorrin-2 dehydrogenase/sirohydrochlorin ferrochelatase [Actinomycetota bacterium]